MKQNNNYGEQKKQPKYEYLKWGHEITILVDSSLVIITICMYLVFSDLFPRVEIFKDVKFNVHA